MQHPFEIAGGRNPYRDLIDSRLGSEEFVLGVLQAIEFDTRRIAFSALAEWEFLGRFDRHLVTTVASLRRPSWSIVHKLMSLLSRAAGELVSASQDGILELAPTLRRAADLFRKEATDEEVIDASPLAEFTRVEWQGPKIWGEILALPSCLSYRMFQEAPDDVRWWSLAGNALFPLVERLANANPFEKALVDATYPTPWFFHDGDDIWCFCGLSKRQKVRFISCRREIRREPCLPDAAESFRKLLGRDEIPENDLRHFLAPLTIKEFIGILLGDFTVDGPETRPGPLRAHRARQVSTGRRARVVVGEAPLPEAWRDGFARTARHLRRPSHPALLEVIGHGVDEKWLAPRGILIDDEPLKTFQSGATRRAFIAHPPFSGDEIEDVVARSRDVPIDDAAQWFRIAATGLAALHREGFILGPVAPTTILVGDPTHPIAVGAAPVGPPAAESGDGGLHPAFCPPEWLTEAPAPPPDAATDVYGLCAVFHEVFTGRGIFHRHDVDRARIASAIRGGSIADAPPSIRPEVPERISAVIMRGLAAAPSARFADAEELVDAIDRARDGVGNGSNDDSREHSVDAAQS